MLGYANLPKKVKMTNSFSIGNSPVLRMCTSHSLLLLKKPYISMKIKSKLNTQYTIGKSTLYTTKITDKRAFLFLFWREILGEKQIFDGEVARTFLGVFSF